MKKTCPIFSGWPDEGLSYCTREVGEDGTHDGLHEYPIIHAHVVPTEEEVMDEVFNRILEAFEAGIKINQQLCADLRKTIESMNKETEKRSGKKRRAEDGTPAARKPEEPPAVVPPVEEKKPEPVAEVKEPTPHSEGGALQVKDVTIEMIRAVSTEFSDSKNFGMDAWLALAQEVTGQKKVKDIPPTMYGAFFGAMKDRLAKLYAERKDKAALKGPALPPQDGAQKNATVEKPVVGSNGMITIELLKEKAKVFMDKNGQPALVALVKAFGATKISEIAKEKHGAFLEAIGNA